MNRARMAALAPDWTRHDVRFNSGDARTREVCWERWREAADRCPDEAARTFAAAARGPDGAGPLLDCVFSFSPYLSRCLIDDLAFARRLFADGPDAAASALIAEVAAPPPPDPVSESGLMAQLRIAKRRIALTVALADIAAVWPLETVTGTLSDFAEAAVRAASRSLLSGLHRSGALALPDAERPEAGSGLVVLGMGKLGARELNYSSDIDLIVLYDEDRVPLTGRLDARRMFVRIARGLVRIIGSVTPQGYVFRTDLRLRPDPSSTPPAVSARFAATYYRESGRTWERAAMIKARAIAGDGPAGEAFLERLRPFVWRLHLDFAGAQDIRAVKQQMDAAHTDTDRSLRQHNVKLGRGGIREIEFFVQAQQLLWGGRTPELRANGTIPALRLLATAGRVPAQAVPELHGAYEFLRRVEHRLQMIQDQQTQTLPADDAALADFSAFMGFGSAADFESALRSHIAVVQRHFGALFADRLAAAPPDRPLDFSGAEDDAGTLRTLAEMGYQDPERVCAVVRGWQAGNVPALRSERSRDLMERLVPALLPAFAAAPDADASLWRFDGFLARLPAGIQLLSLLSARPELLGLLAQIMGSAPRLADWLTRRPTLFDSVLSREFTDLSLPEDISPDPELNEIARRGLVKLFYLHELGPDEMRAQLAEAAAAAADLQDLMDIERRWASEKVFQIGLHMLRGLLSPVEAARPLSGVADACLDALLPPLLREFADDHGEVPGGRVAVIAFGKLGSREMTVSSDLDLLFLYDHEQGQPWSDGRKRLAANAYYARLCRRLIAAVTAPTAEGKLYDVDMRLRPSGNKGPIACSLAAFESYQHEQAWTWEHQALTRARVIWANGGLDDSFTRIRTSVLTRPRDRAALAGDIRQMRDRIRQAHGSSDMWSIKHKPGGLLDVEFIAQYLQLAHASEHPGILAGDLTAVFEAAGRAGLLDRTTAGELGDAARLWQNLQGILRLTAEGDFDQETATVASRNVIGRSCGTDMFGVLVESIQETAERAGAHFGTLLGQPCRAGE